MCIRDRNNYIFCCKKPLCETNYFIKIFQLKNVTNLTPALTYNSCEYFDIIQPRDKLESWTPHIG